MSTAARLRLTLALALALAACEGPAVFISGSSSIVWGPDGALWLTSPDDDAVVALDPETLEELSRVEVPGAPEHLAFVEGALYVSLAQASHVARIEGGALTPVAVPCGGTRAIAPDGRGGVLVTCPNDDRVVSLVGDRVAWTLDSPGRPTALAVRGASFAVGLSRAGAVREHRLDDRSLVRETALAPEAGHAAISLEAIAVHAGAFVATYVRVDHDSDRDRAPARGGYGSVIDGEPRIEPRLWGTCGAGYARFDGGARVLSGPSAVASAGGRLLIAHRSTDDVAALRCGAGGLEHVATHRVGRGPRGLVVSPDGRAAYVDVGFGHAVARIDPQASEALLDAPLERSRALGPTRLSAAALRGRASFDDADDTHLTPSGVLTCATCHPGGGEDGLRWFLHTDGVGPKLRRTPPAWAARPALAPFHWDGEFDDAAALTRATIAELMEGDGLFVDADAIAAWMAEAPPPPGRPAPDEAARRRGEARFAERCASCHAGEAFSDGAAHSVLPESDDAAARMAEVSTPSLLGVRARPPFFHDGRAPDLESALTTHADPRHGDAASMSPAERADLLTFLETL